MRLFLSACVLAVSLTGCPSEDPGPIKVGTKAASKPIPGKKGSAQNTAQAKPAQPAGGQGRKLFLTYCANCHGPDGTGNLMRRAMPKIGDLTSAAVQSKLKDEDIATMITKGRGKMPGFGTSIPADQMKPLIAYVRSLKK